MIQQLPRHDEITMRDIALLILAIWSCGCGSEMPQNANGSTEEHAKLQTAISEWEVATAAANSNEPAVRLAAWQREWSTDTGYTQLKSGVFETQRFGFKYTWAFHNRDAFLDVTELPKVKNEEEDHLSMFTSELDAEWKLAPKFITEKDREAGVEACADLQRIVIGAAVRLEESTSGDVYPESFPESKSERIAMMKGPNRTAALLLCYKTLRKSGKEISGSKVIGDVFSFVATCQFNINGTVSARLSVIGN